jgi:PilZ domain
MHMDVCIDSAPRTAVLSVIRRLHAKLRRMRRDRRQSKRVSVQQTVSITLGNGGGVVTAISDNLSSGGALFYCDRFISSNSNVGLVITLPLGITHEKTVQVWCLGKVLRVEKEVTDGKFGIAVQFTTLQVLPSA